jgi:serine/threonine protein kinase
MRSCILKEGRRDGETEWNGLDGYDRVRQEEKVLLSLRSFGIRVPQVYTSFKSKRNYYLALEKVEGITLSRTLRSKRPIPVKEALRFGIQLAQLLESIHKAGWVWRDCKPMNLIVTKRGTLRPVDFEGACRVTEYDLLPWGTPGYAPRENSEAQSTTRMPEDCYALGAILYHLFTGRLSTPDEPFKNLNRSRRTPRAVRDLINRLAAGDPSERPNAGEARRLLQRLAAGMR